MALMLPFGSLILAFFVSHRNPPLIDAQGVENGRDRKKMIYEKDAEKVKPAELYVVCVCEMLKNKWTHWLSAYLNTLQVVRE